MEPLYDIPSLRQRFPEPVRPRSPAFPNFPPLDMQNKPTTSDTKTATFFGVNKWQNQFVGSIPLNGSGNHAHVGVFSSEKEAANRVKEFAHMNNLHSSIPWGEKVPSGLKVTPISGPSLPSVPGGIPKTFSVPATDMSKWHTVMNENTGRVTSKCRKCGAQVADSAESRDAHVCIPTPGGSPRIVPYSSGFYSSSPIPAAWAPAIDTVSEDYVQVTICHGNSSFVKENGSRKRKRFLEKEQPQKRRKTDGLEGSRATLDPPAPRSSTPLILTMNIPRSKYKNVYWHQRRQKWVVKVQGKDGREIHGGLYGSEREAAKKADRLLIKEYNSQGDMLETYLLNFPRKKPPRKELTPDVQIQSLSSDVESDAEVFRAVQNQENVKPRKRAKAKSKKAKKKESRAKIARPLPEKQKKPPKRRRILPQKTNEEVKECVKIVEQRTLRGKRQLLVWWHSVIGECEEWFPLNYIKDNLPYYRQAMENFNEESKNAVEVEESESEELVLEPVQKTVVVQTEPASPPTSLKKTEPFTVESVNKLLGTSSRKIPVSKNKAEENNEEISGDFGCCLAGSGVYKDSFRCVECDDFWHIRCLKKEFAYDDEVIAEIRLDDTEFHCPECNFSGEEKPKSKYAGVACSGLMGASQKSWISYVFYKDRRHVIGLFTNELDAALATNEKCKALGIPLVNPTLAQRTARTFLENLQTHPNCPRISDEQLERLSSLGWEEFTSFVDREYDLVENFNLTMNASIFLVNSLDQYCKRIQRAEARLKRKSEKLR